MNSLASRSRRAAGFTLIEVLVSLAVLGLMMLGVAQILNGTLITSLGAYKHMDADTQARMVLDRMAYDIAHIVKRSDVDYVFQKNGTASTFKGNDQMAFYSESGGYYPSGVSASPGGGGGEVSLVGYMIPNNAATPSLNNQLCRLSKGIAWNGYKSTLPAMVFNPLAGVTTGTATISTNGVYSNTLLTTTWDGNTNHVADGSDPDYQVIGDQVFRMEFTFLVQSSTSGASGASASAPIGYTAGGCYDFPWYYSAGSTGTMTVRGLQDVTAIVVSIAVLDTKSRAMLGSNLTSSLNTASAALSKDGCSSAVMNYKTTAGYLPLTLWKANLLATTPTAHLGLPKEVWQQVRFYQRFCYLNHLQ